MFEATAELVLDETIDDTEDAAPEIESGTLEDINPYGYNGSVPDENLPAAASIASVPDRSNFLTKSAA